MKKINLCVMTKKGLAVLEVFSQLYPKSALRVFVGNDQNVQKDFSDEMINLCEKNKIEYHIYRNGITFIPDDVSSYTIAISWKWIIKLKQSKLIVFHDSLLPKYRGFNPLVSMLINQEPILGVSVIHGAPEYDTGDIILQASRKIDYPIQISAAIDIICNIYSELADDLCELMLNGIALPEKKQCENEATYSLWRDEADYLINWEWNADKITRMVNAVGFPYDGAITETACGLSIKINKCLSLNEVIIENRIAGKIIFWDEVGPTVVCGQKLLKITDFEILNVTPAGSKQKLPFRTRFKSP